jgi:hypothetical protein
MGGCNLANIRAMLPDTGSISDQLDSPPAHTDPKIVTGLYIRLKQLHD